MVDQMAPDWYSIMATLVSDSAAKKRLTEIYEAREELEEKRAALTKDQQTCANLLAEARKIEQAGAEALREAGDRHRELDARQKTLTESLDAFRAQSATFDEMRAAVDAQQAEREAKLIALDMNVSARERSLLEREPIVARREEAAAALRASYEVKHARLAEALKADTSEA